MNGSPVPPGSTIGVVGGGQLGRMLAQAGHRLGYEVAVLTGGAKDTPAGLVAETEIAAPFHDQDAVDRFIEISDVVTWEFENVDTDWAESAELAGIPIRPGPAVVRIAQDRELEKEALTRAGLPVAEWRPARSEAELRVAVDALGPPVIAKTARWGYDGKGQIRIDRLDAVPAAWEQLGGGRLICESVVPFERELSVVVARGYDGHTVDHGVMENRHVAHILDVTVTPARIEPDVATRARELAGAVVESIDAVGVVAVEMFSIGTDLLVNEIAPRPHNSGHCTIEAAVTDQFEQQLRAITGLPLGKGTCRPAAMAQLLGDLWSAGEPDWTAALADPGIHLHLYGKREARPGRKMGHLTCVAEPVEVALERVLEARERLRP